MDKDTRITYITIVVLIILLTGIAYFLQDTLTSDEEVKQVEQTTSTSQKKVVDTTSTQTTSTTTAINNVATTTTTTMTATNKISHALITTNMGTIEVSFSDNTPNTVKNFVTLAQSKFYDGVRFHRVIKDFMIQSGDPLSKNTANMASWGTGGPGYKFNDELYGNEKYQLGTLAMANAGPNTNGSQFFIVTANPGYPLPPNYTVFGKVTKGIETALKINAVKTGSADRPVEDVIIEKIEVVE